MTGQASMLIVPRSILDEVLWHLRRVYPHEGCGLFLGRREGDVTTVAEAFPVLNVNADEAADRYTMNPQDQALADARARAGGLRIVGGYHSHPDGAALPSQIDTDRAIEAAEFVGPWIYAVIAVKGGTEAELRAFLLDAEARRFREAPLRVSS